MEPVSHLVIPEHGTRPEVAYRYIHDDMLLDGNSRLNLATFVTTWMEPEAAALMAEAFDKNMIDKDEYPICGLRPGCRHCRRASDHRRAADLAIVNAGTFVGALCFLAGAILVLSAVDSSPEPHCVQE